MSQPMQVSKGDGLRDRSSRLQQAQTPSPEIAQVQSDMKALPTEPSVNNDSPKARKTYGRTPDGTVFVVPQTHDMVSTLLSPTQPKNLSDLVVLGVLALHISLLFILPSHVQKPALLGAFIFWRAGYNVGIGILLRSQSTHQMLVHWAIKYRIFDKQAHPRLYAILDREISTKINSADYGFAKAPVEYNTWLVFRRLVDLILMCDFVSYVLFAYVATEVPEHRLWVHVSRWTAGIILFLFNVWVKLDAHRVVKDYAWYWGDFFFMIDQSLTFDGVYDIAPHPMYSVGYAGYYGISLFSASYTVFTVSLIAHAAQFAFLAIVENPHIEKIYNPPAPRRKSAPPRPSILIEDASTSEMAPIPVNETTGMGNGVETEAIDLGRPLLGFKNWDFLRSPNFAIIFLALYILSLSFFTRSTPFIQACFVVHALAWRLFYSVGLGILLTKQSNSKLWTRHFLKYGESNEESWRQWRSLFHISLCMCHLSFVAACWKVYEMPASWLSDMALLKHMVGMLLVLLQFWTAKSIYESIGEFGWFYGDFFFDVPPKLTYSGIYRFLNNPERLLGCAGVWGMALVTSNVAIYLLALLAHVLTLASIELVERPHMEKLYGNKLRREAGLVRSIRKAFPQPVRNLQGSIDKVFTNATDVVEDFIETARKKLFSGDDNQESVKENRVLFSKYPARLTLTRLSDDLANYDISYYNISLLNARTSDKPVLGATSSFKPLSVPYGSPVKISWTAPKNHSKKDWIGLYRVADNASRDVTRIASMNRWTAVSHGEYPPYDIDALITSDQIHAHDAIHDEDYFTGEAAFDGHRNFWQKGVYEFRYHHDGKHNVMAISLPFEVTIEKFVEEGYEKGPQEIEARLLPLIRDCFDRREDVAPDTVDDEFGGLGEAKYARRVVYAVKEMFGLELAPEVVQADRTVRRLAWRICNAKKVLAPFSMSASNASAPTTPQ